MRSSPPCILPINLLQNIKYKNRRIKRIPRGTINIVSITKKDESKENEDFEHSMYKLLKNLKETLKIKFITFKF